MAHEPISTRPPDPVERRVLEAFVTAECSALLRRHRFEDFLRLRTLADHHQHAVTEARLGHLTAARAQLRALDRQCPRDEELALVYRLTAGPTWALVEWKAGDLVRARAHMNGTLHAAARLAAYFGHDYLTAHRIYLATNLARVEASAVRLHLAAERVEALRAVADGTRDRWPHTGAGTLQVPLTGDEALLVSDRLNLLAASIATALRAATGSKP
ncbi:MAG TPA: hypothetical protein VGS19_34500 [Streptosporangiaceae bacterium]|nr:hypothetical protein [Streptosporangiaceae bacterium]